MRVIARAVVVGLLATAVVAGTGAAPAPGGGLPTFIGRGAASFPPGFIQLESEGAVAFPGGATGAYKFSYRTTFAAAFPGTFLLTEAAGTAFGTLIPVQRNTGFDGPIKYRLRVEKVTGTIALAVGQVIVVRGTVDFLAREPMRWWERGTFTVLPLADPI